MSVQKSGPFAHWDPQGRTPRCLFGPLRHTPLDDVFEFHVVIDVRIGGGGLHRLQPDLVHWESRGRRVSCWHVACRQTSSRADHFPHSPKSTPVSQAAAWSSSCRSPTVFFLGDGHCSGGSGRQLLWLCRGRGLPPISSPSGPRPATSGSLSQGPFSFPPCLFGLFLPSKSLYVSLHVWLCHSVSGSPFLFLFVSVFPSHCLSLSKLSPDDSQEVMKGSWIPRMATPVSRSP